MKSKAKKKYILSVVKNISRIVNPYPYSRNTINNKCLFIHIPKTGGTSVLKLLNENQNRRQHLPWRVYQQSNKYLFDICYKFAVVRDPYDRLYSVYNYLKNGGNNIRDKALSKEISSKAPTFEVFVLEYMSYARLFAHNMFLPQSFFVCDELGQVVVDDVIKLEEMHTLVPLLRQHLSIDDSVVPHVNKSKVITNESGGRYTFEMRCKVNDLYISDFDAFEYERIDSQSSIG